jgi:hypothetical protein
MHTEFIGAYPNWQQAFGVDGIIPTAAHTAFMDQHFGVGPCNLHFIHYHTDEDSKPLDDPGTVTGSMLARDEVMADDGEWDELRAYSNGVYVVFREGLGCNGAHFLFIKA